MMKKKYHNFCGRKINRETRADIGYRGSRTEKNKHVEKVCKKETAIAVIRNYNVLTRAASAVMM